MNRTGFTLVEALIVIVIIGAVAGMVYPRIAERLEQQNVRSARHAVTTLLAKARAHAIQRGQPAALVHNGNDVLVVSRHPVTQAIDTIGAPLDIHESYGGVLMTWSRDSLAFDARGIGMAGTSTLIVFTRSTQADSVRISSVGSIIE